MKKIYLYIIIGILIVIIISLLTYKRSTTYIFKEKNSVVHDFGKLKKKDIKEYNYEFKYVNELYDTLKVYKVIDGCGCTFSQVKIGNYFKNDTIKIKTSYNPHKYNDSGIIKKKMFLVTNKPISTADTILPLTLKGYVK